MFGFNKEGTLSDSGGFGISALVESLIRNSSDGSRNFPPLKLGLLNSIGLLVNILCLRLRGLRFFVEVVEV